MLNLAVLISGSGSNLQALIDATADPAFPARIVCVVSDTDAPGLERAKAVEIPTHVVRPRGFENREAWGQALAAVIHGHGIQQHVPAGSSIEASSIEAHSVVDTEPGLVVSAGLMRILPQTFVETFSPNLINTHPALLPLYPGAHAVRDALAAGATETGVSVHIIDAGVDTGPVLRQTAVDVRAGEREEDLHERIKQRERPMLVDTVRDIAEGRLVLSEYT